MKINGPELKKTATWMERAVFAAHVYGTYEIGALFIHHGAIHFSHHLAAPLALVAVLLVEAANILDA